VEKYANLLRLKVAPRQQRQRQQLLRVAPCARHQPSGCEVLRVGTSRCRARRESTEQSWFVSRRSSSLPTMQPAVAVASQNCEHRRPLMLLRRLVLGTRAERCAWRLKLCERRIDGYGSEFTICLPRSSPSILQELSRERLGHLRPRGRSGASEASTPQLQL